MRVKSRANLFLGVLVILAVGEIAVAKIANQTRVEQTRSESLAIDRSRQLIRALPQENVMRTTDASPNWTDSQKKLIDGSKKAILQTGMSQAYFDKHFKLVDVIDRPSDRRVIWKFSINEYEATVIDSIGFYTEGTERKDTHSVGNTLVSTTDIRRTIPRKRALRIMRSCLGKFANTEVEYSSVGFAKATLVMRAYSAPKSERVGNTETRNRKEKEARERATKEPDHDVIEEDEDGDRPPVRIGTVDLVTGRCTKGIGRAGPLRPR